MFIIEISYNVLYVWHCMELYDKKFFINGNCMIRSFGQPGPIVKIVPQWETFHACPWSGQGEFNVAEVLCQVHESGDMTSFCYYDPRQICKKLIEQLESEFGLQMYSAIEYEFVIFKDGELLGNGPHSCSALNLKKIENLCYEVRF